MSFHALIRPVGLALALAASTAAFAAAAGAAPAPDAEAVEVNRAPFERSNYSVCTGNYCQRMLYKVPQKKRLDVASFSCKVIVKAPGAPFRVGLLRVLPGGGQSIAFFPPAYMGTENGSAYYALHTTTLLYVNAGEKLVAFANSTDTTSQINCTVSGHLVTLK